MESATVISERIVVVGGGLAGVRTVEALRGRGYRGSVTLIGAEPHKPYDRPPLSKQVLTGQQDDTTVDVDIAALGVDLRLGETVTSVRERTLWSDARAYSFDGLVAATGARPIRLPGDGPQRVLRTIDDAIGLRGTF